MSKKLTTIIIWLCAITSGAIVFIDGYNELKFSYRVIRACIILVSINIIPMYIAAFLARADKSGNRILAAVCVTISALSVFVYDQGDVFGPVIAPAFQLVALTIAWPFIYTYRRVSRYWDSY